MQADTLLIVNLINLVYLRKLAKLTYRNSYRHSVLPDPVELAYNQCASRLKKQFNLFVFSNLLLLVAF